MRFTVAVLAGALAMTRCEEPSVTRIRARPTLPSLEVESIIFGSDSFVVSGVAVSEDCGLILTGGQWGSAIRVHPDGSQVPAHGLGGARRELRVTDGGPGVALVWARDPPFLGILNHDKLQVRQVTPPVHAWGMVTVGSAAALANGRIAVAAFFEGAPVARPDPWIDGHLIAVSATGDSAWLDVGSIPRSEATYLSWLAARTAIGSSGDTLLALGLSDGILRGFVNRDLGFVEAFEVALPRYFEAPVPREEVWVAEWISVGGAMPYLIEISQVAQADIAQGGRVVAVRPYMAEWRHYKNRYVPTQGGWELTELGLEIYSSRGGLIGAFALPSERVNWIRADRYGRIFLSDGRGHVYVASDPTFAGTRPCQRLPSEIRLRSADIFQH